MEDTNKKTDDPRDPRADDPRADDPRADDPHESLASEPCVFCKKTSKELERFIIGYVSTFALLIIGYCGYVTWMVQRI